MTEKCQTCGQDECDLYLYAGCGTRLRHTPSGRIAASRAGDRRGVVSVANPGKYNPRGTDSQRMPVPIACLAGVSTELADHWQRADYSLGSTPSGGTLSPIERAATTGWAGSTSVSSGRKLEETEGANTGETGRVADSRNSVLSPRVTFDEKG